MKLTVVQCFDGGLGRSNKTKIQVWRSHPAAHYDRYSKIHEVRIFSSQLKVGTHYQYQN